MRTAVHVPLGGHRDQRAGTTRTHRLSSFEAQRMFAGLDELGSTTRDPSTLSLAPSRSYTLTRGTRSEASRPARTLGALHARAIASLTDPTTGQPMTEAQLLAAGGVGTYGNPLFGEPPSPGGDPLNPPIQPGEYFFSPALAAVQGAVESLTNAGPAIAGVLAGVVLLAGVVAVGAIAIEALPLVIGAKAIRS